MSVFLSVPNKNNLQTDLFDPEMGIQQVLPFQYRVDQQIMAIHTLWISRAGTSPPDRVHC